VNEEFRRCADTTIELTSGVALAVASVGAFIPDVTIVWTRNGLASAIVRKAAVGAVNLALIIPARSNPFVLPRVVGVNVILLVVFELPTVT
jgi:hypothetical protein